MTGSGLFRIHGRDGLGVRFAEPARRIKSVTAPGMTPANSVNRKDQPLYRPVAGKRLRCVLRTRWSKTTGRRKMRREHGLINLDQANEKHSGYADQGANHRGTTE